jgi:(E)-4-hydroxy-3-methyl-but-2-enyl pyrophosphate reductase
VPTGGTVVFSAHGVPPETYTRAEARGLTVVDATCPLVNKVHVEARRLVRDGYHILLIGHADHDEIVGTSGEAPLATTVVQDRDEAARVDLDSHPKVACLSQTTLAVDDVHDIVTELRQRRPDLRDIAKRDLCYATQNRQQAVKALAGRTRIVIVVGSPNSSNSRHLVQVAEAAGASARLIDNASELREQWFLDGDVVGLSSGASAPEVLVDEVLGWFGTRWELDIEEITVADENVVFRPPAELERLRTVDGAALGSPH